MKKKLLLITLMVALFICALAICASGAKMTNYCDVEITLTDGTVTTGYCKIDTSDKRLLRDNIYTTTDTSSETIAWESIKIFDASKTMVVGGVDPIAVGGLNCNYTAINTTDFYFPPTTETILNTTFTSGWESLQKVWIPKSVVTIDHDSFCYSPISSVIFEEGSKLKTIGQNAFQACSNLTSIDLPEGLESIGRNGFYQAGLSGTMVIPNSVTYLAPGSMLSTKIKTLILGDGALQIGHNFAGDFNSKNNAYLENIYISASTTFDTSEGTGIFFKCKNPVNFYVVGTKNECDDFITRLNATTTSGNYITFVLASEETDQTSAGYGILHTEYNRCKAFYNEIHSTQDDKDCSTALDCVRCKLELVPATEHNSLTSYDFSLGFTGNGSKTIACTNEGCEHIESQITLDPIIEIIGYSAKMNGDQLCVGYKLNNASVEEYNLANSTPLSFGVVAIVPINEDELKPLYVENGEVKAIDYTISADLEDNYASFDFIIKGFDQNSYDTSLVMCAYVFNGEKITYICSDTEGDTATTFKYSDKAIA